MILNVENIKFAFEKDKPVLDRISFKTNGDNVVAVVGPSGCGKSTLLRLLCGMIQNKRGNYFAGNIEILIPYGWA